LIHKDRFPFAVPLVLLHMAFCTVFTAFLYMVRPSMFPSLTDPTIKVTIDRGLILKGFLIAVFFAGQLILSNTAYLHSSVAFLQMMKEANLVLVYVLSLFAAIERFDWRNVRILVVVAIATALTVHGELNFSWQGFAIQGLSQLFECCKIVLQALLLSSAGKKLDSLTYLMLVAPFCFLVLGTVLLSLIYLAPNEHLRTPTWGDMYQWWPHLIINACIAFALNVIIAFFIKLSSAVAFILAGIVKDAMIVFAGCMVFQEVISIFQGIGFLFQLAGIFIYSMVKASPKKFEDGVMSGLATMLCGYNGSASRLAKEAKDYGAADNTVEQTSNNAEAPPEARP